MPSLPPLPDVDDTGAVLAWVGTHLGHLTLEGPDGVRPGGHRGGQAAADTALATLDVTGYARSRSTVLPEQRRGATRMSPYVRHGLVSLPEVWVAVAGAATAIAEADSSSACNGRRADGRRYGVRCMWDLPGVRGWRQNSRRRPADAVQRS